VEEGREGEKDKEGSLDCDIKALLFSTAVK